MKKICSICLFLLVLSFFCTNTFATNPVTPSTDLTYLGAFKLPTPPSGFTWGVFDGAGYNGPGMTYYPPDSSLLVVGAPSSQSVSRKQIAEVSIPSLKIDTYANLNTATLLHGFGDVLNVDPTGTYMNLGDVHYYAKQGSQSTDKLYISVYGSYIPYHIYKFFNGMFAWTETDLDNLNANLQGWWRFANPIGAHYVGKYLFNSPTIWANTNTAGKSLIAGYYRGGGSAALGPTMYAFAPWEECGGSPIDCDKNPPPDAEDGAAPDPSPTDPKTPELKHTLPYVTLLQYGGPRAPYYPNTFPNAAPKDRYNGGAWLTVGNKQAVVFYGIKKERSYAGHKWSYPNAPAFVTNPGEGYHDGPGRPVLVFYSVDDLAEVAAGTMHPYEPQPYAMIDLSSYFYNPGAVKLNGITYDESSNILYLRESTATSQGGYHAVHAFQFSDVGTLVDTTLPSTPSLKIESVSHEAASFSWTASTDNSGRTVRYEIYRNDAPMAFTGTTSFTDVLYEYYPSPVEYYIVAIDFNGNRATSNSIYVDDSSGGNEPINMFIPIIYKYTSAEHETSTIALVANVAYSLAPTVKGGTAPYTWSQTGFPSGLGINQNTGQISGTVTSSWSSYTPTITVQDANGNICRRRVAIKVRNAPFTDLDNDGYDSIADGGTDTNDLSINVSPHNPAQPAPTSMEIKDIGTSSVTLRWTAADQRQDITADTTHHPYWQRLQGDLTYQVYHGTSPGTYTDSVYVGRTTIYTYPKLDAGTHYFAVTALSYRGLESDKSNEISAVTPGDDSTVTPGDDSTVTPGDDLTVTPGDDSTVTPGDDSTPLDPPDPPSESEDEEPDDTIDYSLNGQAFGAYFVEGGDETNKIVQTADGGVALISFTSSYAWSSPPADFVDERDNKALKRLLLVKADSNGIEQWRRVVGPEGYNITSKQIGSNVHWYGTGIIQTGADDLIVSGYRGTAKTDANGFTGVDGFLMKFDKDGNIVWDRSINGTGTSNDFLFDVVERPGGGFASVGSFSSSVWLVLTDISAQTITKHTYSRNGKGYEVVKTLRRSSDGGYIMAGWTSSGANPDEDYYVVKTTSDGTLQWAQKFDNDGRRDKSYGVEEDNSGNFWVFGRSQKPGVENTRILIVKLDSQGVYQESYEIGDDLDAHAYICRGSLNLGNGNFLAIGYTNVSSGQGYNGYVAEINTFGEIVGSPKIIGADASGSEDYLFSGVVSGDGLYYLLAGSNNGAFSTGYDLWYLKLSADDKFVENFTSCPSKTAFYYDKDLDGSGNSDYWEPPTGNICLEMPGYVADHSDCDDRNPDIHPLAAEICGNGTDEDCDGNDEPCTVPGGTSPSVPTGLHIR